MGYSLPEKSLFLAYKESPINSKKKYIIKKINPTTGETSDIPHPTNDPKEGVIRDFAVINNGLLIVKVDTGSSGYSIMKYNNNTWKRCFYI